MRKDELREENAALAEKVAQGDRQALGQLWLQNQGFIHKYICKWYSGNKEHAAMCGLTIEDLEQESYFAVLYAAETYAKEKGAFTTWLAQAMRRQIMLAMCGGHRRNITGEDGKRHTVAVDMLNSCTSLDCTISNADGKESTVGELQEDPAGLEALTAVEDRVFNKELAAALQEAIEKLPELEAEAIKQRYCLKQEKTHAKQKKATQDKTASAERRALRKLQLNPVLRKWREEIIGHHSIFGTGFQSWAHGGAVQEKTIEFLERRGAYICETVRENEKLANDSLAG